MFLSLSYTCVLNYVFSSNANSGQDPQLRGSRTTLEAEGLLKMIAVWRQQFSKL